MGRNHDFKFVLEVMTPSQRIYHLQAQTASEYDEWFYVLSNQCARLLLRKNTVDKFNQRRSDKPASRPLSYGIKDQNDFKRVEKVRLKSQIMGANPYCADCGTSSPEWCSINVGFVICVNCCGVHRGLGTHISKMRSLQLDDISIVSLKCIQNMGGNEKLNKQLLECNLKNIFKTSSENELDPMWKKINYQSCTQKERSNFIKYKYAFKMFINQHSQQENKSNQNQKLWNAVTNNDFFNVLYFIYHGAEINHQFEQYSNKTVLHEAVERNYTEMVQLLVSNEAQANIEDGNEETPTQIAIRESLNNIDNLEIQNILKTAVF